MFELRIKKGDFEDLVKKMSLPTGKDEFIFETIAPTVTPEGYLEWIGQTSIFVAWVRAKKLDVSGITGPIVIALKSKEIMKMFKFFKGKNEIITLIQDTEIGEYIFTADNDKRKRTITLQAISIDEAKERRDKFPEQIDEYGVIVSQTGLKPNLHSICDSSVFHELVKNTNKIMEKKKEKPPYVYHIIFDGANNILRTIAGDITDNPLKTVDDKVYATSVKGNGIVHYAYLFPEVVNVLTSEIELHAFEGGPLWIVQDSDNIRIRYLIPPTHYGNKVKENKVEEKKVENNKVEG
jgi:hypothetical protein